MKLCSFRSGGKESYGVVTESGIVDVGPIANRVLLDLYYALSGGCDHHWHYQWRRRVSPAAAVDEGGRHRRGGDLRYRRAPKSDCRRVTFSRGRKLDCGNDNAERSIVMQLRKTR